MSSTTMLRRAVIALTALLLFITRVDVARAEENCLGEKFDRDNDINGELYAELKRIDELPAVYDDEKSKWRAQARAARAASLARSYEIFDACLGRKREEAEKQAVEQKAKRDAEAAESKAKSDAYRAASEAQSAKLKAEIEAIFAEGTADRESRRKEDQAADEKRRAERIAERQAERHEHEPLETAEEIAESLEAGLRPKMPASPSGGLGAEGLKPDRKLPRETMPARTPGEDPPSAPDPIDQLKRNSKEIFNKAESQASEAAAADKDRQDAKRKSEELQRLIGRDPAGVQRDALRQADQVNRALDRVTSRLPSIPNDGLGDPGLDRFDGATSGDPALDRFDGGGSVATPRDLPQPGLDRFDSPRSESTNAGPAHAAKNDVAALRAGLDRFDSVPQPDGLLTNRKMQDNSDIQANRDAQNPRLISTGGMSSQEALSAVSSGSMTAGEINKAHDPRLAAPAGGVILRAVSDVTFAPDRSMMYVGERWLYRVEGETAFREYRKVRAEPIRKEHREGYSDKEFVTRQTVWIRAQDARALPPTKPGDPSDPGAASKRIERVMEAAKPAADIAEGAGAERIITGQWADPQSGAWVRFPKSLDEGGYEPGPGGIRTSSGISVYLGNKKVPEEWSGGDWGKDVREK